MNETRVGRPGQGEDPNQRARAAPRRLRRPVSPIPRNIQRTRKSGASAPVRTKDEAIRKGSFARGQRKEPRKIDPDEGYGEEERESSPTGTQGQDDDTP